jgi:hypothetical protein
MSQSFAGELDASGAASVSRGVIAIYEALEERARSR